MRTAEMNGLQRGVLGVTGIVAAVSLAGCGGVSSAASEAGGAVKSAAGAAGRGVREFGGAIKDGFVGSDGLEFSSPVQTGNIDPASKATVTAKARELGGRCIELAAATAGKEGFKGYWLSTQSYKGSKAEINNFGRCSFAVGQYGRLVIEAGDGADERYTRPDGSIYPVQWSRGVTLNFAYRGPQPSLQSPTDLARVIGDPATDVNSMDVTIHDNGASTYRFTFEGDKASLDVSGISASELRGPSGSLKALAEADRKNDQTARDAALSEIAKNKAAEFKLP